MCNGEDISLSDSSGRYPDGLIGVILIKTMHYQRIHRSADPDRRSGPLGDLDSDVAAGSPAGIRTDGALGMSTEKAD